jgi:hypothetical protein
MVDGDLDTQDSNWHDGDITNEHNSESNSWNTDDMHPQNESLVVDLYEETDSNKSDSDHSTSKPYVYKSVISKATSAATDNGAIRTELASTNHEISLATQLKSRFQTGLDFLQQQSSAKASLEPSKLHRPLSTSEGYINGSQWANASGVSKASLALQNKTLNLNKRIPGVVTPSHFLDSDNMDID